MDWHDGIVADTREPKRIAEYINSIGRVPVESETLDVGDYSMFDKDEGLILVTRKASDLWTSLFSGHLSDEFSRCIELIREHGSGRLFFLLEGVWASDPRSGAVGYYTQTSPNWFRRRHTTPGAKARAFMALQISMQTAGIQTIWTGSAFETALALTELYKRASEGWPTDITQGIARPPLRHKSDPRPYRLQALWPHLSKIVATKLIAEWGSVGAVLTVALDNPEELLKTSGVGQKTLDNLEKVLE